MAKPTEELCPRCFIGRFQEGRAVLTGVYQGKLLALPRVKAFTCDICGYREFDDSRMLLLSQLLPSHSDSNTPPLKFYTRNSS